MQVNNPPAWVLRGLITTFACAVAVLLECNTPEQFSRLDEAFRDAFVKLSVIERPETRLAVIDISEATLSEIGSWPWPRSKIADLADALLGHYGARAIAFDVVFPEALDLMGDRRLASLAASGPLTLAQVLDFTPRSTAITQGILSGGLPKAKQSGVPAYGYIANHIGLAETPCVGNIGYIPDPDGVLRRIPILTEYKGYLFPHLAGALLSCVVPNQIEFLDKLGTGTSGLWRVPYRYALSSYTVVSAADILKHRVSRNLVEDRFVLVGSSALGLGDRVSTPLSTLSAGIMVHAASLSGILDVLEGVSRAPWSGRAWIIGWIFLTVIVSVLLVAKLSAWLSMLVLFLFALIWLVMASIGVLLQAEGSISAPLSAYFVLLVTAIPHEWWRSQRRAKRLLNTFSHYVAKPVLNELLRAGATYSLTPTLREVTVLIADMEGYTQTTSLLSLEDAATLTKDFLDCLTRPVLERHGTLDKYTGDGLVAFWGAPLVSLDQADQAVSAALAILEQVNIMNMRREKQGFKRIRVRIGIESGGALVGDLGTSFRSTYTAVGDCINFASRLERAARDLPVQVVIGPEANRMLMRHKSIALGRHTLRGTATAIELFTIDVES